MASIVLIFQPSEVTMSRNLCYALKQMQKHRLTFAYLSYVIPKLSDVNRYRQTRWRVKGLVDLADTGGGDPKMQDHADITRECSCT